MSALWLGGRPITLGQAMYRSGPPNLVSLSNQHQLATRPVCTYPVQVEFCTPSCAIRGQMDRHRLPSCGDRHPGAPDQVVPSAPAHRHLQLQGRPALSNCNYNAVPNVSHGVQYVAHPQAFVSHLTTCTCTSTASHSAKCPTPQPSCGWAPCHLRRQQGNIVSPDICGGHFARQTASLVFVAFLSISPQRCRTFSAVSQDC